MDAREIEEQLKQVVECWEQTQEQLAEYFVGNWRVVKMIYLCLLSEGHILLEGAPGTAKTSIAKAISKFSGCHFQRVQGAVDVQPADIIGIRVFEPSCGDFVLKRGPLYTNFLLIDEINRLTPKTQSAFLEAMSEKQATIDGFTVPVSDPFIVIATQNIHESEGTFPLIHSQKDRFMFSLVLERLDEDGELEVLRRVNTGELEWQEFFDNLNAHTDVETLRLMVRFVRSITVDELILAYIRDIVMATRTHADVRVGASTRASIAFVKGIKALAAIDNRRYAIPDDVKEIAPAVLRHRLELRSEARIRGRTEEQIIQEILQTVTVP
ncbi:MAG: ATPase associated with various cellular activities AAA_3 [Methanoculleus marisnigri]|jgi:MoxR-like ATPases|uniref:ATPase associated with various cellular activities AAA_3 n=1 Tax=Methanoculleus marisnigri TaxID=2198 RepID=A0A117MIB6_9EURY|nr:MoxR family ATPase [Methanoculleus marisnigri]KUK63946.1 MAG: ATPase associated with various cellular activities AAA_3 [Methanoculleus marisnigri]KUL05685.1 MAG: ATPase associated with various cellular activities AAA_3 [Methanoculleus marisnigri]